MKSKNIQYLLIMCTFFVSILMVLTATAVPQVKGKKALNIMAEEDVGLSEVKEKTLDLLEKNEKLDEKIKVEPCGDFWYMLFSILANFLDQIDEFLEDIDIGEMIISTVEAILTIVLLPVFLIVDSIKNAIEAFKGFINFIIDEIINDPKFL